VVALGKVRLGWVRLGCVRHGLVGKSNELNWNGLFQKVVYCKCKIKEYKEARNILFLESFDEMLYRRSMFIFW
jgi:hypothetical protein